MIIRRWRGKLEWKAVHCRTIIIVRGYRQRDDKLKIGIVMENCDSREEDTKD